MRRDPTWRIPAGILLLLLLLLGYGLALANYVAPLLTGRSVAVQTIIYAVLGLIWLLPLRRFLVWMETGSWR